MSITIADYSYRQLITGDAPASSLSGFCALITADNVDSTFFDNVDNGGGDIRVSLNSDGTSQIPLQVEVCNTSTDKLYAWARFPTYSTAAREIYIFAGNSGETQPAVTATYGRNNVWQDYLAVNHGRDLVNSTGGNDFTVMGTAPTAISQKHGAGWNFDAGNGLLISTISAVAAPEFTLESFGGFASGVPSAGSNTNLGAVSLAVQGQAGGYDYTFFGYQSDTPVRRIDAFTPRSQSESALANSSELLFAGGGFFAWTRNSSSSNNVYGYTSSASITDSFTATPNNPYNLDTFGIGGRADSSEAYFGNVTVEARARIGVLSADHLAEHASNYIDPANFWTQSTPDDPSGGGGGSISASVAESSQAFTAAQAITVVGSVTLAINEAAQPFSAAQSIDVSGSISSSIIEQAQAFTTAIALTSSGNLTASIVESAQPFTTAIAINSTGNITALITEQAQPFTTALGVSVSATTSINISVSESAQVFTSAIDAVVTGNATTAIVEQAQAFTTSISINNVSSISGTILESAQVFVAGVVIQGPTTWTDVVFLDTTWSDSTSPTNAWANNPTPTNTWTDK